MFYLIGAALYRYLEKCDMRKKSSKYKRRYSLASNFDCMRLNVRFYGKGDIVGGDESYVGHNTSIQVSEGYRVIIGKRSRIGHNVKIYTSSVDTEQDFMLRPLSAHYGDVVLGDGAWVGANVVILPNVKIGKNSTIGANSVVTRDVPDNAVYGGVPARLIKQ